MKYWAEMACKDNEYFGLALHLCIIVMFIYCLWLSFMFMCLQKQNKTVAVYK